MEIQKIFATPIWQTKLNTDMTSVAAKCLQMRDSSFPDRKVSNMGGWQSKPIRLTSFPEFHSLEKELVVNFGTIGRSINPDVKLALSGSTAWININEKGNYNTRHLHAGAALSAVVYVKVDDKTGRIRFYDDHTPIKHYPFRMPTNRKHFRLEESFQPYEGMLIVFPGWIPHTVEPSQSDTTRISIAMNLSVADVYD